MSLVYFTASRLRRELEEMFDSEARSTASQLTHYFKASEEKETELAAKEANLQWL